MLAHEWTRSIKPRRGTAVFPSLRACPGKGKDPSAREPPKGLRESLGAKRQWGPSQKENRLGG